MSMFEVNFEKLIEKMEQDDKNKCSECTHEDCLCCEIYKDRMSRNDFYDDIYSY